MDRSNKKIDSLNTRLKNVLKNVVWIDTTELDNECGDLKSRYTKDGLHLSSDGYIKLEKIVSHYIG